MDGLGVTLVLGLGLADGLGLEVGEGDALSVGVALPLGDGLAVPEGLSLGAELSLGEALGCADSDSWTLGVGDAVGSNEPVRAVMVSCSDGSGLALSSAADSSVVDSSTVDSPVDGSGVADGSDGVGDADGEDEGLDVDDALDVGAGDASGLSDSLADSDSDSPGASWGVGSQRAGIASGINHGSGSLESAGSFGAPVSSGTSSLVESSSSFSTAWVSSNCSLALAGSVEVANDDATTAVAAAHATIVRSIVVSTYPFEDCRVVAAEETALER